jgi:hypothetical protein
VLQQENKLQLGNVFFQAYYEHKFLEVVHQVALRDQIGGLRIKQLFPGTPRTVKRFVRSYPPPCTKRFFSYSRSQSSSSLFLPSSKDSVCNLIDIRKKSQIFKSRNMHAEKGHPEKGIKQKSLKGVFH